MIRPVIVDIYAAAAAVGEPPAKLRSWLHRGYITRHGHDRVGRALVDVEEVQAYAQQRKLDQSADLL